jgi:hypothetical protein
MWCVHCIVQGFVAAALEHFWSSGSGIKDDKHLHAGEGVNWVLPAPKGRSASFAPPSVAHVGLAGCHAYHCIHACIPSWQQGIPVASMTLRQFSTSWLTPSAPPILVSIICQSERVRTGRFHSLFLPALIAHGVLPAVVDGCDQGRDRRPGMRNGSCGPQLPFREPGCPQQLAQQHLPGCYPDEASACAHGAILLHADQVPVHY